MMSASGDKCLNRPTVICIYAMEDAGALSICADLVSFTNLKKEKFHGDDLAMIVGIGGLGIILPNFKGSGCPNWTTQGVKGGLHENTIQTPDHGGG